MKFGFQVMLRGSAASGDGLTAIAKMGEDQAFDIIAPNDHIIVPNGIQSTYPYTEDGIWPGASVVECHDQLTALAFIAGKTNCLRILTSVMVVPYREPVLTAKIIATADVLSEGRVILGCGAGWMAEEMEAIGVPPFKERGKVTDEYLEIFKELWTNEKPSYDGNYSQFSDIYFKPKPVQKPHPPIWIGGESKAALRRVAKLGDGWFPAANNPKFIIKDPSSLKGRVDTLKAVCDDEGRDFEDLDIGFFYTNGVSSEEVIRPDGERQILTGSPSSIADDISKFSENGVGTLIFIFQRPDLTETLEQMEWFGTEIMSMFKNG
ncbi:MAG: hypothetical protein CMM58_00525 [Rhodospirillaceae bacterium]|nr:hypothetical protein [Rhodospirillaceae bacterium]|tara:strand:- start:733 stop:1695 length:963 start_codon:yes stop_codon:yes gene_type:complete